MSFFRQRVRRTTLGPRGRGLGDVSMIPVSVYASLCCPVCGARGSVDRARAPAPVTIQLHCSSCGNWTYLATWRHCQITTGVNPYPWYPWPFWSRRRPAMAPSPMTTTAAPMMSVSTRLPRPASRGGGGGRRGLRGLGVIDMDTLPPTPAPGEAGEEVALLRRVAAAQEAFNAQDMKMRQWQIAATVAIPVAATFWNWFYGWLKGRGVIAD